MRKFCAKKKEKTPRSNLCNGRKTTDSEKGFPGFEAFDKKKSTKNQKGTTARFHSENSVKLGTRFVEMLGSIWEWRDDAIFCVWKRTPTRTNWKNLVDLFLLYWVFFIQLEKASAKKLLGGLAGFEITGLWRKKVYHWSVKIEKKRSNSFPLSQKSRVHSKKRKTWREKLILLWT